MLPLVLALLLLISFSYNFLFLCFLGSGSLKVMASPPMGMAIKPISAASPSASFLFALIGFWS